MCALDGCEERRSAAAKCCDLNSSEVLIQEFTSLRECLGLVAQNLQLKGLEGIAFQEGMGT